jgi:hypothetical protein
MSDEKENNINEGHYYTYDPSRYRPANPTNYADKEGGEFDPQQPGEAEQEFDPAARLNFKFFDWRIELLKIFTMVMTFMLLPLQALVKLYL